ncbi:hypothetical protein DFH11DRAFT_1737693 [Phellopilus nigrolimitatus]|nr:hypothetical protein DFH11DRAFT_1737693 [Phellopilus nigrolimitatus]
MAARFKEVSGEDRLPWEALHIAILTKEAALMLALASVRFKAPAVVKANEFGERAGENWRTGEHEREARAFVDVRGYIHEFAEFLHDSSTEIAKRLGDTRRSIRRCPMWNYDGVL